MPAPSCSWAGMDAGKSTLARATAAFALRLGRSVAYLDADVAQKTVGPPATVGMKHIREPDDLTLDRLAVAPTPSGSSARPPAGPSCPARRCAAASPGARARRGADLVDRRHRRRGERDPGPAREVLQGRRPGARPRGGSPARRGARSDPRGSSAGSSASRPSRRRCTPTSCRCRVEERMAQRERMMRALLRNTAPSTASGSAHRLHAHPAAPVRPACARPPARGPFRRARRVHRARLPGVRGRGRRAAADLARGRAAESP